jgi:hypothetical protein
VRNIVLMVSLLLLSMSGLVSAEEPSGITSCTSGVVSKTCKILTDEFERDRFGRPSLHGVQFLIADPAEFEKEAHRTASLHVNDTTFSHNQIRLLVWNRDQLKPGENRLAPEGTIARMSSPYDDAILFEVTKVGPVVDDFNVSVAPDKLLFFELERLGALPVDLNHPGAVPVASAVRGRARCPDRIVISTDLFRPLKPFNKATGKYEYGEGVSLGLVQFYGTYIGGFLDGCWTTRESW